MNTYKFFKFNFTTSIKHFTSTYFLTLLMSLDFKSVSIWAYMPFTKKYLFIPTYVMQKQGQDVANKGASFMIVSLDCFSFFVSLCNDKCVQLENYLIPSHSNLFHMECHLLNICVEQLQILHMSINKPNIKASLMITQPKATKRTFVRATAHCIFYKKVELLTLEKTITFFLMYEIFNSRPFLHHFLSQYFVNKI